MTGGTILALTEPKDRKSKTRVAHSADRKADWSPGDFEIRRALLERLKAAHRREPDTAFFEELGLCRGQVRADIAVVNGALHGYEIKSDRDSLRRLGAQVAQYSLVFDRATLVVGPKYLAAAEELLPHWWEIQVAEVAPSGAILLRQRRQSRKNPDRNARSLVEMLWLQDAVELVEARGGARGYRGRPRRLVWDRVCELYALDEIASAVRLRLKSRSARRAQGRSV